MSGWLNIMSLELYGFTASQPVRSVIAFCKLNSIPYNYHIIELSKSEQRTEEYRKISPFELVPAIVHGEYNLWEAAAIVTYLADAFNVDSHWYPKDIKKRGRINAYFHWHHTNTRFYCRGLLYPQLIAPKFYGYEPSTPECLHQLEIDLRNFLREFNDKIGNGYVCGTEMTIADIFAYNEILNLMLIDFDHTCYANISRWFQEIELMPEISENLAYMDEFKIRLHS